MATKTATAAPTTTEAKPMKAVQIKVLEALVAAGPAGLTKQEILKNVFDGNSKNLAPIVGSADPEVTAKQEYPSLLTLGLAAEKKIQIEEGISELRWVATAKAPKALEKAAKDLAQRETDREARKIAKAERKPRVIAQLEPGQKLHKSYKGKEYDFTVSKDRTITYKGKAYTSLGALAMDITGFTGQTFSNGNPKTISGPAFFGLTKPAATTSK